MVEVPAGIFLCGPIQLASRINLHLDAGAVLRMLPLDKYPGGTADPANFISGAQLHDVAISGSGMIDGQGIPWWPYARVPGARRPRMIALSACNRVLIENVTLSNSPMFHIAIERPVGQCHRPRRDHPRQSLHRPGQPQPQHRRLRRQRAQCPDRKLRRERGRRQLHLRRRHLGCAHHQLHLRLRPRRVHRQPHQRRRVQPHRHQLHLQQHRERHPHQIRPRPRRLFAQSQIPESAHDQRGLSDFDLRRLRRHQPRISRAEQPHARHRRRLSKRARRTAHADLSPTSSSATSPPRLPPAVAPG